METKKDRTATIAVVAGVVALLLGLCLGGLVGGIGGFLIGRQASPRVLERSVAPLDEQPEMPYLPEIPGIPRMMGAGGALVREVISGSPAQEAGLRQGDLLTAVDAVPVDPLHPLRDTISQYKPGDRVALDVWRSGELRKVTVTLGEDPNDPARPYLGIYYINLPSEGQTSPGD